MNKIWPLDLRQNRSKDVNIRLFHFIAIIPICLATYAISLYLLGIYTEGDRKYYGLLYGALSGSRFHDVFVLQRGFTGSEEPLYGVIMWVGAIFFDNIIFVSIWNSLLVSLLTICLIKNKAPVYSYPFILTNYYLVVLLTSAERLKMSIIFLILSLILGRYRSRFLFLVAAPLTHVQTLILYGGLIVSEFTNRFRDGVTRGVRRGIVRPSVVAGFAIVVCAFGVWQRQYIQDKFASYGSSGGDAYTLLMLSAVSLFTFRSNLGPSFGILSLCGAAILVGDSRLNMIGFMVYFYFCLKERKIGTFFFMLISLYLSYKTIGFVTNVMSFGSGFSTL